MATRFLSKGFAAPPRAGYNVAGVNIDTNYDFQVNFDGVSGSHIAINRERISIPLTASSADTHVFIAPARCIITSIQHVVSVGASGATLQLRKCTGTTAPASGTALTTATQDLNATANTVTSATLAGTSTITLAAGDRIAADFSGTLTGLFGVATVEVRFF